MTTVAAPTTGFLDGVRAAALVAAEHADDVDRQARFPAEAVAALREARALSALVDGVPFDEVARACELLGRSCSASAMVFAMHQIQVACLLGHPSDWTADYLLTVSREQRLIGSVTSEVGTGGDTGRSVASVVTAAAGLSLVKHATTVSYGAQADDFLTTVRRSPDSEPTDQVAVLHLGTQTTLTPTGSWDPLGMRGTCSPGFTVSATFAAEQVLVDDYARISRETMVPVSHLLWASLWTGIATEAFERARKAVRSSGPAASSVKQQRLSQLHGELTTARAYVEQSRERWLAEAAEPGRPALQSMSASLRHNALKISLSDTVARICTGALDITGIAGYRNDSPLSIGRLLRDSLSASLMVSNDRLHATDAALLMVVKEG